MPLPGPVSRSLRSLSRPAMLVALLTPAAGAQGLAPINCLIEPQEVVRLSTPVAGTVAAVLVERGDVVQEGDVIARLDSAVEAISLALATTRAGNRTRIQSLTARHEFLTAQAERMERLAASNAISTTVATEARLEAQVAREELAEAEIALELAGLERQQAQMLLEQKTLTTPINGVVVERLLAPGEFRDAQTHFMSIARLDVLRVEAFAPIAYYDRIAIGDTVTIHTEEPIGGAYPATVTIVDRVFDAATATFGLRMSLPNTDLALPAGLRCQVTFDP